MRGRLGRSRRPGPAGILAVLLGLGVALPGSGSWAAALEWCHEVRRGESLEAVARRAGTTADRLRRLNGLGRTEAIRPGHIIALPALSRLRAGRLPLVADPLPAAPGNLARENAAADRQRLSRLRTRKDLERFGRLGLLAPVAQERRGLQVVGVPGWRRVARPWTRAFVYQLGGALHTLFAGARLRVTDLTLTENVQQALLVSNGNAAPAHGPRRSTHLTGASVDLSKTPHAGAELAWLRLVLRRLAGRGVISPVEEFVQPHFHVMVFREYGAYARRLRSPLLLGGC